MALSDYRRQLQALLPLGMAWARSPGATLTRFLDGVAEEFARIDARISAIFEEADPRTTVELLGDWERIAGLPDNCSGVLRDTVQARRQDLLSKLSATGGQSPEYFIGVARSLGFEIRIEEPLPFRIGETPIGTPIYDDSWHHVWRVIAPETTVEFFDVSNSSVGEPLARWGNGALECRINHLKPAHTIVQFIYTAPPSYLLLRDGSELLLNSSENVLMHS